MKKESQRIIGINPGTRYIGIAILYGSELMDWRVKVLDGKWSKEKIKKTIKILSGFIDQYEANVLAIKKLHPSRRSENLVRLANKIKDFARSKKLKVHQYTIKELEKFFLYNEKLNRTNLVEKIVSEYPVLIHEVEKEKTRKNPYRLRMFEAVALGASCLHKLFTA